VPVIRNSYTIFYVVLLNTLTCSDGDAGQVAIMTSASPVTPPSSQNRLPLSLPLPVQSLLWWHRALTRLLMEHVWCALAALAAPDSARGAACTTVIGLVTRAKNAAVVPAKQVN